MCYMLFLASDTPLGLIPWREDVPEFNVSPLDDSNDERRMRERLNKPFTYCLGSYEGCGCGFFDGSDEGLESLRRLHFYLMEATVGSRIVELLSYGTGASNIEWDPFSFGTNAKTEWEVGRKAITPDAILDPEFCLEDGVFYTVLPCDIEKPRERSSPHLKTEP